MLLASVSKLADMDFLLQKHFTSILSLVWREKFLKPRPFRNGFFSNSLFSLVTRNNKRRRLTEKMDSVVLTESSRLVSSALASGFVEEALTVSLPSPQPTVEELELTLEFTVDSNSFPSVVSLNISNPPSEQVVDLPSQDSLYGSFSSLSEDRFRFFFCQFYLKHSIPYFKVLLQNFCFRWLQGIA